MLARFGNEPLEIFDRSQIGMDSLVAPLFAANGPGAAHILSLRGDLVVLAFAEVLSDRMDRRQIQNVEAHLHDARQLGLDVAKGAVPSLLARRRTGKELVPGAVC